MFTYFFVANSNDLTELSSESDLLNHISETNTMVGGRYKLEQIDALLEAFSCPGSSIRVQSGHGLGDALDTTSLTGSWYPKSRTLIKIKFPMRQ